jgi:ABC-type phosphate transport system permease subunit
MTMVDFTTLAGLALLFGAPLGVIALGIYLRGWKGWILGIIGFCIEAWLLGVVAMGLGY